MAATGGESKHTHPHLSVLALISFIGAFAVARTFTTLAPNVVILVNSGIHIHHFWYGLVLLAIGGWLGISTRTEKGDQWAAVLYGLGWGFIADEFGLLLTFGNYWTTLTYTIVAFLLVAVCLIIIFMKHASAIRAHFARLPRNEVFFMLGGFLAIIAGTFLTTSTSMFVIDIASAFAVAAAIAFLYPLARYFAQRRAKPRE